MVLSLDMWFIWAKTFASFKVIEIIYKKKFFKGTEMFCNQKLLFSGISTMNHFWHLSLEVQTIANWLMTFVPNVHAGAPLQ